MSERLENIGLRADLRMQKTRLEAEVEALRDTLRRLLPKHEDVIELNGEKILNTAIALNTNLEELKGIQRKIAILNRELGE